MKPSKSQAKDKSISSADAQGAGRAASGEEGFPPVFRLLPGKEKLARNFHPWVYSGALRPDREPGSDVGGSGDRAGPPPSTGTPAGAPLPAVARLEDSRGVFVAWAQVNPNSKIRLRLFSWDEAERPDAAWLSRVLERAIGRRLRDQADLAEGGRACRLVFSEADGIPGLILDLAGSHAVLQSETGGMDAWLPTLKEVLPGLLTRFFPGLRGLSERSDGDGRKLEGLPPRRELWWGEEPSGDVTVREGPCTLHVDLGGQKTGFYSDQEQNRRICAPYAAGRSVLDVFCYTGAFSLHAAHCGAKDLTLIDSSADALALAQKNLNSVSDVPARYLQGDAFKVLRDLKKEEKRYGFVVLDPPKLAPSRSGLDKALAAYKDLNLQALSLLEPEGMLATFSCSGLVSSQDLLQAISFAAKDAGLRVQIVRQLFQAPDHPVLLSYPESLYLKGFLLRVL